MPSYRAQNVELSSKSQEIGAESTEQYLHSLVESLEELMKNSDSSMEILDRPNFNKLERRESKIDDVRNEKFQEEMKETTDKLVSLLPSCTKILDVRAGKLNVLIYPTKLVERGSGCNDFITDFSVIVCQNARLNVHQWKKVPQSIRDTIVQNMLNNWRLPYTDMDGQDEEQVGQSIGKVGQDKTDEPNC
ncbi:hypothetical protein V8G54_008671 [Vigna mungo]|uniref:Uncharacterized protein n=1 Tax=Vigna mungo TaxID=3915 RepID=A0AAQ3SA93_VIGMU